MKANAKPEQRSAAEIEDDCVKLLGEKHRGRIVKQIELLQELYQYAPWPGYRPDNKEYFTKLRDRVNAAINLIEYPPARRVNNIGLFVPGDILRVETESDVTDLFEVRKTGRNNMLASLMAITQRCEELIKCGFGVDPRHVEKDTEYYPRRAADAAAELCALAGKTLDPNNAGSTFCQLAALMHEAATGNGGRDLRRACAAIARQHRPS
jgi:hypothetical protein